MVVVESFGAGMAFGVPSAIEFSRATPRDGYLLALFAVLSLLLAVNWLRPIVVYRDEESEAVHLDECLLILMLLLLPASWTVTSFAVAVAAAQAVRRRPLVKSLFNWGQVVTSVGLAVLASRLVAAPAAKLDLAEVAGAGFGAVVFFVANNIWMAAILNALGTPWRKALPDGLRIRLLLLGGCIAVGAMLALAISAYSWSIVLAVVPLLILFQLIAGHFQARHDRSRLRGLFRAALEANRFLREGDVVAPILSSARSLLRCSDAVLTTVDPGPSQLSAEMAVNGEASWLVLSGRGRNEPLDAADAELLRALAAVGAGALTNAALYQEIRQQRERLSAITGSLGEGVCALDHSGRVTFMNPAARSMLGWAADAEGTAVAADFLRGPADAVMLGGGLVRNDATTFRHLDGRLFPVALTASAIVEGDRQVGAVIVFRDISERQELEKTRARLVAFLDASPDFVALTDAEGGATYVNPAGRAMLGLDPYAVVTSYSSADFHPASWTEAMLATVTSTAAREGVWRGESTLVDRQGRELTVDQVVLAHYGADGGVEFFSTTARDITELRRLENQLHVSQKLEALGRLAGGVAHDFNNVLAVISLCAELLSASVEGKCRDFVSEIHAATGRATALTDQLLTFSRRQHFDVGPVDPAEVIIAMEHMLSRLIGDHIQVSTTVGGAAGCCVQVDRGRLEQVVMNLALNARDSMPDGGVLRIHAAKVAIEADESPEMVSGDYVKISVSDTGTGMSAETQAHLFEPFFTTKARGEGTGLGLATVEGIVAHSRGRVSVESRLGVGTTLTVYLPMLTASQPAMRGFETETGPIGTSVDATVLLVEDETAVRRVEALLLETAGYRVLQASDGVAALEVARAHRGDITVVVTDVLMPRLSGPALVEELLRNRPELKVLFVSGYTEDELKSSLMSDESPLLSKPFTASTLLAALDATVRGVPAPQIRSLVANEMARGRSRAGGL